MPASFWYNSLMITHSSKQQGSAHVVIIIILVVAILGLLGYIIWNNYLAPKDDTTQQATTSQTEETEDQPINNKLFKNGTYSFEYPTEGWRVEQFYYNDQNPDVYYAYVKTDDWEPEIGMGLKSGAEVLVHENTTTQTLAELKDEASKFANGAAKNVTDTKVAGVNAFTYNMSYEGERYHTVFVKGGKSYDLIYQYPSNGSADTHMDGYKLMVSTFKFL